MNATQRLKQRYNWLKANFAKLRYTREGWLYNDDWIAGYAVDIDEVIDAAIAAGKGEKKEDDES